jgi:hypothetical protein
LAVPFILLSICYYSRNYLKKVRIIYINYEESGKTTFVLKEGDAHELNKVSYHLRRLTMGILSGNPKDEPLHYGEVFDIWSTLLAGNGMVAGYQTMLNHTGDDDLKKLLLEAIELCQQNKKQVEELLKENGVGLPPTPPERPEACLEDIPVGARILDPEIAATLSVDIAAGLVAYSQVIGKSIREDVAMMYVQFHTQKVTLGAKVLRLNKEKGWLIPPPLHLNSHHDC